MKILHKITCVLAAAVMALSLASCTNDEKDLTPIAQPANATYTSDFGSITLTWDSVPEAGQYQYIVRNPLSYVVAKGFTTSTSVTVGSLSPATTYKIQIKAIPAGVDAEKYTGSDYFVIEATTAAPKTYDYAWSFPAKIWWNYDSPVHESTKAVFGLTKDGKYVIQSWGGVVGMDLVFTLSDKGEWLIDYAESTCYVSGPDGNTVLTLAHGIGGTQKQYCYFYENNTGSSFTGNETGGKGEAWMYNPDGDWTGYYFTYGEYKEPEPEPTPIDADPTEALDRKADITVDGENIGTASVKFDPSTGIWTVDSWYGVEGYGIAFKRDATTGEWIIDTENSSAYISGPDSDGNIDMAHGLKGKGYYTTCLLQSTISGSGLFGETLSATISDPQRKSVSYVLTLIPDMKSFSADGKIYVADTYMGDGTITYDAATREYTIDSWYGVEGYSVVFTLNNGAWVLDTEKSTAYLSGPDGNNAIGLAHGIADAPKSNCWFYVDNTGSWFEGNEKAGVTGCSMYDHNGSWSQYRFEWKEGDWSSSASVFANQVKMGDATISYSAESKEYTLHNWYGVEGYDVVFSLDDSGNGWILNNEKSTAYTGGPDDNGATGLANGVEGAKNPSCWFYGPANSYTEFHGDKNGGNCVAWMWIHDGTWSEYKLIWPATDTYQ